MRCDEITQFLAADLLLGRMRISAEDPHDRVSRYREQGDERPEDLGDDVDGARTSQGHGLNPLQCEPLRHELTENKRKVSDDDSHRDETHGSGPGLR